MTTYKRQLDIFNPSDHEEAVVTIAGAGNIGSHTALALARMGLKKFHIFDFDDIEEHNLASQSYPVGSVGQKKVVALAAQIAEVNPDASVFIYDQPFTGVEQKGSILISAVDSMEGRREIAAGVPAGTFVIDGRMGGGQIEVWSQPIEEWHATLTVDGDQDPCSARYISYTSYIIAGFIANNVKRHLMNERVRSQILFHANTLQIITK